MIYIQWNVKSSGKVDWPWKPSTIISRFPDLSLMNRFLLKIMSLSHIYQLIVKA